MAAIAKTTRPTMVWRFDYVLKGADWNTCIAGYNQEECIDYLRAVVGPVHVTAISQECRLDAISDNLRNTIMSAGKRKPGRPKKED